MMQVGWWRQDAEGHSFAEGGGEIGLWGDGPADIVGEALDKVVKEFQTGLGRLPTAAEIIAGFKFSLNEDVLPEVLATYAANERALAEAQARAIGGTDS